MSNNWFAVVQASWMMENSDVSSASNLTVDMIPGYDIIFGKVSQICQSFTSFCLSFFIWLFSAFVFANCLKFSSYGKLLGDKHYWIRSYVNIASYLKWLILRWFIGLKLIQLEQQKTELPLTILAKKFQTNTMQVHKRYIKIFELEINNLLIQILAAKTT